jgi:hypothetical protein
LRPNRKPAANAKVDRALMTTAPTTATAVDAFLDAITAGRGIPIDIYAPDATLDATVPGWRFAVTGPAAICAEYGRWFDHPARFEELERNATTGGEVITYLAAWEEQGELHAAHHCHLLTIADDGRIAHDAVWCGGRWGAQLMAEMGAVAPC